LWALAVVLAIVVLVCVAVYVPAVQRFAFGKASQIVERETGIRLAADDFRVRFPLGVTLTGVTVVMPEGDTLAQIDRSRLRAALLPLLKGRVRVMDFGLEGAAFDWRDSVSGMSVRGRIDTLDGGAVWFDPAALRVRLGRTKLYGGEVAVAMGSGEAPEETPSVDTLPADAWQIEVDRFELRRFGLALDMATESADSVAISFDYNHLRITDAALTLSDLTFNTASGEGALRLADLHLAEKSGLKLLDGEARLAMNPDEYSLTDLTLTTPRSDLSGWLKVGAGITTMEGATPIEGTLSTHLSPAEIALFAPLPEGWGDILKGREVTLTAAVSGTLDKVRLDALTAALPPNISLHGRGDVRHALTPEKMSGNITLDGRFTEMEFARAFIPDSAMARRVAFPRLMTLRAAAKFSPTEIDLHEFTFRADSGRLDARGRFVMGANSYDADVRLTEFPLGTFLPHDSLGGVTLAMTARGSGFDPMTLTSAATLTLDRLDWQTSNLGLVTADLTVTQGHLVAAIRARNDLIATNVSLDAQLARDTLRRATRRSDAYRERIQNSAAEQSAERPRGAGWGALSENRFAWRRPAADTVDTASRERNAWRDFASRGTRPPRNRPRRLMYSLSARIDSTLLRLDTMLLAIAPVTLEASASRAGATASIRSGDLTFDASSPLPPNLLLAGVTGAADEMMHQMAVRHFNPDSLQNALPPMTLTARAGRKNFLHDVARQSGFDFRSLALDISTTHDTPLSLDAVAVGVTAGGLVVDTLSLHALRNGAVMDYGLRMANRPTTLANLGLIRVSGSVGGRSITANVLQRNNTGRVGFDFGVGVTFSDTTILARMMPDPVLGYEKWVVGRDKDWLAMRLDGILHADLNLTSRIPPPPVTAAPQWAFLLPAVSSFSRYISLTSASLPGIPEGALRLSAGGLDIGAMLELFPTAPPVGGLVSSDLTFGFHSDGAGGTIIAAQGSLGAKDLAYDGGRIADLDAKIDFGSGGAERAGAMLLDATVALEGRQALTAKGTWAASEIDFTLGIPGIPLSVAQGMMPSGTATLGGNIDGTVHITGTPDKPVFTGDVGFTGGRADIALIGTTYRISPDRIRIADEKVTFTDWGVVAPNDRRLAVNGAIDISNLTAPRADMTIRTRGFQFVNSRHLGGSQIYGTGTLNANITARGLLDAMRVRGDVDLDGSTDIVYIMRSTVQEVRNEKQHIVQFVTFADSLYNDDDEVVPIRRGGIDMLLGVGIGSGLKATLSLDEHNENRVQLIGGGDLTYSMNPQGDTRLSGRYSLSGGTLYYKPPVIPQKVFAVSDGSYVEWAGAVADPRINLSATQKMNVRVEDEANMARDVDFDITVGVAGSLAGVDMKFDVGAPSDPAIQNQLLGMSTSERMQQALGLLIYNRYTAQGMASKGMSFDAKEQLGDFISKEINQWARNNLKGVDFSMGIDTRTDATATGGSRTDYSYSVTKSIFSDRVKISIGGKVSDEATSANFANTLLEDVSFEYRLTRRDNMFLKLYRYNTRESMLEGEVTETGVGILLRKKVNRFQDIFRFRRPRFRQNSERLSDEK
jgi:hypothetical protein